jgi:hypothetical protein
MQKTKPPRYAFEVLPSAAEQFAEKLSFVSGYRFSDTKSGRISRPFRGPAANLEFSANCQANVFAVLRRT